MKKAESILLLCTKNRCYQFRVVPFGLVTSLAAIVKCLEIAPRPEVDEYVGIFVDHILVISKSFEEQIKHLNKVFEKLRTATLVLKLNKCEFIKSENKFLGHVTNADGIGTDPERIESII